MLPANPGGFAAMRKAPPTITSIKPGNVAVSGTAQIKCTEELRYLPIASMPTKPCNAIAINSYNHVNNNNSVKHINSNNATATTVMKTKLTQINLLQNQLKPNANANAPTATAQPRYKFVPSNASNGNANSSLMSVMSPKSLINPNNNSNTQSHSLLVRPMTTVPVHQQQQHQQQNGLVYNNINNIKTSPGTKGAQANVITLVAKKSASDPATTIRSPVILSKAAVEKLRLKFGQVQAQGNAGAVILSKPLNSNNNNSAISRPAKNTAASHASHAVPKITIPAVTPMPTPTPAPMPVTLSTHAPLTTPMQLTMTPSMTSPTTMPTLLSMPLHTTTPAAITMDTPVTLSSVPINEPMDVPTVVPTAVPSAMPMSMTMAASTSNPTPMPLSMTMAASTSNPTPMPMAMTMAASTSNAAPMPMAIPMAVSTSNPRPMPMAIPMAVSTSNPRPMPMAIPMAVSTSNPSPMPMLMPRPIFMPMPAEYSITGPSNSMACTMPTPLPMPLTMQTTLPMPTLLPNLNIDQSKIKISPLPDTNGAIISQNQPPLAVIMPTLQKIIPTTTAAATATANVAQQGSPKLQRSKSLAENVENPTIVSMQNTANERRHSVAIMAKEVDVVVEQPMPIETITIDDDDSDEEKEVEAAIKQMLEESEIKQQHPNELKQASRKTSTASRSSILSGISNRPSGGRNSNRSSTSSRSSDVELVMVSESQQPVVQKPQEHQPEVKQQKEVILQNEVKQQEEPKQQEEVKLQNEVKQQEEPKQQEEVKLQNEVKQQEEPKQQEEVKLQNEVKQQKESKPEEKLKELKQQEEVKQQPLSKSNTLSIIRAETLPVSKEDFEKSLRCDEQASNNSPISESTSNISITSSLSSESTALRSYKRNMEQHFGMLHWWDQHQPGTLQNSNMRFELNRFNLLQIMERCEPRRGPASYFDMALFDRSNRRTNNSSHPLLYLCSRCNCHGPASDFLAPRFCSLSCVRRANKRRQTSALNNLNISKQRRIEESTKHKNAAVQSKQQKEKERKSKPGKRAFRWTEYINIKGMGSAAPIHLFLNPFPTGPNCFERGMKLEAIDPENCSLFCVCTIVEVRGYRLKLNFDGYASMYDFWVNADSMDIFPPGWCERTSRILQTPKGYCPERFTWYRYLVKTNAKAAPCALFTHLNGPKYALNNGFRVGMHLEAEDLNDTGKICVATIADVLDERVRVHFDGWDDCYDFWVHVNSPYIHPCGWHEGRQQLIVPPDYQNINFNWSDYIAESGGAAAPPALFASRQPMEFQARMKLEVVDQRNPCLIRPATVVTRKSFRVQLHLDCWPTEYYFWLEDDSPDLHPIGWCEATSHELETPPGYLQPASAVQCDVIEGCRGYGNAKNFNLNMHVQRDCCPYAPDNWRQWRLKTVKPPRVAPEDIKQAEPPKLDTIEEPSEVLMSNINSVEISSVKPKSQRKRLSVKSRTSLEADPAPKVLKHEEEKPLPVEHKPEPTVVFPTPAKSDVDTLCLEIAKSIVTEYGPRTDRNYRLWQANSGFNMDQLKSNPLYWTTWDVYEFIERALNSTSIAQMLFDEEIDGRALLMLGRKDLANYFHLKIGPSVTLFSLIVNLRIAVVSKFETLQDRRHYDPDSFDPLTLNSKHERAESTSGESMSSSSSCSEQMENSQEEEGEEEMEEEMEDEQEKEVDEEEDEEAEEADEEEEETDEEEEETDEEEEETEEMVVDKVVEEEKEDQVEKVEQEEYSEEEEQEQEEDEQENEPDKEEEQKAEQEAVQSEEHDEEEEEQEEEQNEEQEEYEEKEDENKQEESTVDLDHESEIMHQVDVEKKKLDYDEETENEKKEQEISAGEEEYEKLKEQETNAEKKEQKHEESEEEYSMGEEEQEQESDAQEDDVKSTETDVQEDDVKSAETDAKNIAEDDSDYYAREESEDFSEDNAEDEADEYDDDDYDDKILEQELNQSKLNQYPKQEISDEEDVVLDSDDFLSVKPSIVNHEDMETDDVITSSHLNLRPSVDDSVEDIS